jgi:hypothetical protein
LVKITVARHSRSPRRKEETNDRLFGVAIHCHDLEDLTAIEDVSKTLLPRLEEFPVPYNNHRGKKLKIPGTGGPGKTMTLLKTGTRKHKADEKRSER